MKKIKMGICCLLLGGCLLGCSNKVDTFADVSNGSEKLNVGKEGALTVGEIYNYIRDNNNSDIVKNIMMKIMKDQVKLEGKDADEYDKKMYSKYLNEHFKTYFLDEHKYDYDGEFSEELLVKYLQSEGYNVSCNSSNNSLLNAPFTCDYTNYIENYANYDIYLKILNVKYILNNSNLLDKSESRKISYYPVKRSSSTDFATRENLEDNLEIMKENIASNTEGENVIRSLNDIANLQRKKDLEDLNTQYLKISTSNDSSFSNLEKFTKCGNKRCTHEKGKEYLDQEIIDKEYLITRVVNKNNYQIAINGEKVDALYQDARDVLFSKNIEEYLYKIGNVNYLIASAYINDDEHDINDIILFDNSATTYYVVEVEVLDSSTTNPEDKIAMAELLLDKVSSDEVWDYYFGKSNIEIYDEEIRELFIKTYKNFKKDN